MSKFSEFLTVPVDHVQSHVKQANFLPKQTSLALILPIDNRRGGALRLLLSVMIRRTTRFSLQLLAHVAANFS